MRRDDANDFRRLLDEQPPRLATYVNTPWESVPDLASYNAEAFRLIERRLKAMARRTRAGEATPSQGVLVLGEAGTGKTHLLMRVAQSLSAANPVMFIHKPNNEEAVAQHIWSQLIESLTRAVPGLAPGQSQLDHLLAHAFTAILMPLLEQDIHDGVNAKLKQRWLKLLRQSPNHLFGMLEGGAGRQKHLDFLRNRVLGYLRVKHPDVDQTIARALINYCFLASDRDRRSLLTWLMGQQIEETTAKRLGVGALWCEDDRDDASDVDIRQQRQAQAIRAIQTIGDLSRYYRQPLILAFDQLEGMRGERKLTQRWGDVIQQIFTVVPNMLAVTCVFPSLWDTWFHQELHQAIKDRIAQDQIALDRFAPEHGEALLTAHLRETYETLNLPDPLYPFEPQDVAAILNQATTPRVFLQRARQWLDDWLAEDESPVPTPAPSPVVAIAAPPSAPVAAAAADEAAETKAKAKAAAIARTIRECLDRLFQRHWDEYDNGIPNEEDFFGRVQRLAKAAGARLDPPADAAGKAINGHRVMPINVLIKPAPGQGAPLCLAVCHNQGASLKARLDNLIGAAVEGKQFQKVVVLRDARCPAPSGQAEALIAAIDQTHGRHVIVGKQERVLIQTLYDGLTAVEQRDLVADDEGPITEAEYLEAAQRQGWFAHSRTFAELAAQAPWLAPARGPTEAAQANPLPIPAATVPMPAQPPTSAPVSTPAAAIASTPASSSTSTSTATATIGPCAIQPEILELARLIAPDLALKTTAAPQPPLAGFASRAAFVYCEGEVVPPDAEGLDDPSKVRSNPAHAETIARIVDRALRSGVAPNEIAVIAPYEPQASLIRGLIANPAVTVSTLAALPDRSWPMTIIDITDDQVPPTALTCDREWLKAAVLRAGRQLAMVGNPKYLTNFRFFPVASLLLFRSLLSRCQIVPASALQESGSKTA